MSAQMQIREEIIEALELLNKAAREEKEELRRIIRENFQEFADLCVDTKKQVQESIGKKTHELNEKVSDLDEKLHDNPWPYIAATAVSAFIAGMLIKSKD